jgi:predicted nucleotide modification protein, DUF1599 family
MDKISNTKQNFISITEECKNIFMTKTEDYGTSWRIFRPSSLTDQIYIKAKRIRKLQEAEALIDESIEECFKSIINYSVMALIQTDLNEYYNLNLPTDEADILYTKHIYESTNLMLNKTHDYDEAWREMRISSMTDIILTKLLRIKQIEDNDGKTLASEGVIGNYQDIINYSMFCLIKIQGK